MNNRNNKKTIKNTDSKFNQNCIVKPLADMGITPKHLPPALRNHTARVIKPAENYDVISFARAMNPDFGPRVKEIFGPEVQAAKTALATGVYVGWRCPEFKHDCQRVGPDGRCFCGHNLSEHKDYLKTRGAISCQLCPCRGFAYVPSRPEEVGEYWFKRRPNYQQTLKDYRLKCKCKHTHEEHDNFSRHYPCGCGMFTSAAICAACDRHWEDHETRFESAAERQALGLPVGAEYMPFAEMPSLAQCAATGVDNGFQMAPSAFPAELGADSVPALRSTEAAGNEVAFRPDYSRETIQAADVREAFGARGRRDDDFKSKRRWK